jgi:hypothetical protein
MSIRNLLVNTYGWPDNPYSMRVLQDSGKGIYYPTKANIIKVYNISFSMLKIKSRFVPL